MQRWSRWTLLLGALLLGVLGSVVVACTHGQVDDLGFSIGVRGEGNQLVVNTDSRDNEARDKEDGYVIAVQSERGIGDGTIAWWGNRHPHHLWFQLDLDALEHFNLRWGEQSVTVNVNSTDHSVFESLQVRGQGEVEIGPDSPFWIEVSEPPVGQNGFVLKAPDAFLDDSPGIFALSWIDYFR